MQFARYIYIVIFSTLQAFFNKFINEHFFGSVALFFGKDSVIQGLARVSYKDVFLARVRYKDVVFFLKTVIKKITFNFSENFPCISF